MKKLTLILLILSTLFACKPNESVDPIKENPNFEETTMTLELNLQNSSDSDSRIANHESRIMASLPDTLEISIYWNDGGWRLLNKKDFDKSVDVKNFQNPLTIPFSDTVVLKPVPQAECRFMIRCIENGEDVYFLIHNENLVNKSDSVIIEIDVPETTNGAGLNAVKLLDSLYDYIIAITYDLKKIDHECSATSIYGDLCFEEESIEIRDTLKVSERGSTYKNEKIGETELRKITLTSYPGHAAPDKVELTIFVLKDDKIVTRDTIKLDWLTFGEHHFVELIKPELISGGFGILEEGEDPIFVGIDTTGYELKDRLVAAFDRDTIMTSTGQPSTLITMASPLSNFNGGISLWLSRDEIQDLNYQIEIPYILTINVYEESTLAIPRREVYLPKIGTQKKHHIVITWKEELVQVYFDNEKISEFIEPFPEPSGVVTVYAPNRGSKTNNIILSKFHAWNHFLTVEQVGTLYNNEEGKVSSEF